MFEKLTPRLTRVIKLSQIVARDYDQEYVGTEHLLLAMLKENTGIAAEIMHERGVTFAGAKKIVDELIQKSLEDTWVFGRLPGTPHFRNVMAKAIEEARQLESKVVCTEHLLLALAREEGSVAQATLHKLDLRVAGIRQAIVQHLDKTSAADARDAAPPGTAD
jgi:ATP-dependent Clp protease ATP-binding subunit ClpC